MKNNIAITGLQLITSVARLGAFAFSVLTIGKISGNHQLLLVIGYLPYLAFFDILIQSTSRAMHLRGKIPSDLIMSVRRVYAPLAIGIIISAFFISFSNPLYCQIVIIIAWPLGAIGFIWEKWIAQNNRQVLLSMSEILIIVSCISFFKIDYISWKILLICIISFPMARLVVLTIPTDHVEHNQIANSSIVSNDAVALSWRYVLHYILASLTQQFIAASASSLPAIYAQITGDMSSLSRNVTIFRSLNSLSAIISLTINSMSSRIFYKQTGQIFDSFEEKIIKKYRVISLILAMYIIINIFIINVIKLNYWYMGAFLLPAMAVINAESSLLYNRGLPIGTMHCQFMIFILSLSFVFALDGQMQIASVVLLAFLPYMIYFMPKTLMLHKQMISSDRKASD